MSFKLFRLLLFLGFFLVVIGIQGQNNDLKALMKDWEIAQKKGEELQVESLLNLATYYEKKDSILAMSYLNQALQVNRILKDSLYRAKIDQHIGRVLYFSHDYGSAILHFTKSNKVFETVNELELLAIGYRFIGSCYFYHSVPQDSAIFYFKKSISLKDLVPPNKHISRAHLFLAWSIEGTMSLDSAIFYAKKGIAYNKEHGFKNGQTTEYLAHFYHRQGQLKDAAYTFNDALNCYLKEKDTLGIYEIQKNLIYLNTERKNYNTAKEISRKNINMLLHAKQVGWYGDMYVEHGRIFSDENIHLDSAEIYIKKALQVYNDLGDDAPHVQGKTYVYLNLGDLYIKTKEYIKAKNYLQKALAGFQLFNYALPIGVTLYKLCDIAIAEGNFEEAKKYGLQAREYIDETDKQQYAIVNEYLSQVYEGLGNHETALEYYKKYAILQDSFDQQLISNETKELLWELKNKDQEIAFKEKENQLLKREKRIHQYFQLFGFGLLLLLSGVIYFLWRRKKEQDQIIAKLHEIQQSITPNLHQEDPAFLGNAFSYLKKINNSVAQLKQSNQEFNIKEKELKEVVEDLRAFNYMVSHDLKKPIQRVKNITYYLEYGKQDHLDDSTKEYLNFIKRSTEQMEQLINAVLSFSLIDKQLIHCTKFSGKELIREICEDFTIALQQKNIHVHIDEIPLLFTDRELLKRVFTNLIDNAIKFAHTDRDSFINLKYELVKEGHHFQIMDNGIGFNQEETSNIFNLFHQIDNNQEGTGTGLAIVKRILERLGGRIQAMGQVNEGATFTIYLPVKTSPSSS